MGPEEKERPFVKRKSISVLFFKEEGLFKENTLKRNKVIG